MHYPESFKVFGKRLQCDTENQFAYLFLIPGIMRVSLFEKQDQIKL